MTQFDHIISLGSNCGLAYNLRRFFNFGTAYPLDWWISSERTVEALFSSWDVDALYDPSNLEPTEGFASVKNVRFDVLLHHEFPRDYSRQNHPVVADFRDHVEIPKRRTAFLMDRLHNLNVAGQRMLFVRMPSEREGDFSFVRRCFDRACCTVAMIPSLYDHRFGWKGDPDRWNAELAKLHATLSPGHKPFDPRTDAADMGDGFPAAEIETV